MHYYKRHIGDYMKQAGRLSMLQHGSYTLLIDSCYDRERFPTEKEAIEWCWASTLEEIDAVKFVLSRFFCKDEDGIFMHKDIKDDLSKYAERSEINKRIANERETKRAENNTDRVRSVANAQPNHKPLTTNHKPLTNNQEPLNTLESTPLPKRRKKAADALAANGENELSVEPVKTPEQEVLQAYSDEYERRYGVPAIQNAKLNSQIKQFCQRIPKDISPMVARFYVQSSQQYHVLNKHPFGLLLHSAEAFCTDWQTGTRRTVQGARDTDAKAASSEGWRKAFEESENE